MHFSVFTMYGTRFPSTGIAYGIVGGLFPTFSLIKSRFPCNIVAMYTSANGANNMKIKAAMYVNTPGKHQS